MIDIYTDSIAENAILPHIESLTKQAYLACINLDDVVSLLPSSGVFTYWESVFSSLLDGVVFEKPVHILNYNRQDVSGNMLALLAVKRFFNKDDAVLSVEDYVNLYKIYVNSENVSTLYNGIDFLGLQATCFIINEFLDSSTINPILKAAVLLAFLQTTNIFGPFNGRMARLINFYVLQKFGVLNKTTICLSRYFYKYKDEYSRRIEEVSLHNNWEEWFKFYLNGIIKTVTAELEVARVLFLVMKEDMISVHSLAEKQKEFLKVYDILCTTLSVEVQDLTALTDIDTFTVYRMLRKLEKIGIIKKREEDGKKPTYEYYRQANAFKYLTKI